MAYGNHHISTQFTGVPQQQQEGQFTGSQQQQQQQQPHLPAQGTGYPRYGGSDTNVAQQQQQPPISPNEFYNNLPQHTGFQNYPSYPQNQGTAPDNSYLSQQPSGASTRQNSNSHQYKPIQINYNHLNPILKMMIMRNLLIPHKSE